MPENQQLLIDAKVNEEGIEIIVSGKSFPIVYPREIWNSYDDDLKQILKDNIAYSSTLFLPTILKQKTISYKTDRPLAETFLFKNGIYDMPSSAEADKKSSTDYVVRFFNVEPKFESTRIKTPKTVDFESGRAKEVAVIPFSFGKESLLSVALCRELGIKPILVNFIEPVNKFEYYHKQRLIKEFEKEHKIKVYTVKYNPGRFRYGRYWGLQTELGWGLQTTEYSLLTLPFVAYFKAKYIVLGNEQSCNDIYIDKYGNLTYRSGFDQYSGWTTQQGLLASLLLGRRVEVVSLVEPLFEIAETKILQTRYPAFAKYQMSCMADNEHARNNRWCQHCAKCGYMFALFSAFSVNMKSLDITENLFDYKHRDIYKHILNNNQNTTAYGRREEIALAFYLAYKNNSRGYTIDKFKKLWLKKTEKNLQQYLRYYFGIHHAENIPTSLKARLFKIYREELQELAQSHD